MAVTLGDIIEKFAYCENGGDPEVLDEWLDEWLWQIKDADATYKSLPDPIRYVWAGMVVLRRLHSTAHTCLKMQSFAIWL
jgi:hypothetical protein